MLFYKTLQSHLNVYIVYIIYSEYELFSYFLQYKWDPIFMVYSNSNKNYNCGFGGNFSFGD